MPWHFKRKRGVNDAVAYTAAHSSTPRHFPWLLPFSLRWRDSLLPINHLGKRRAETAEKPIEFDLSFKGPKTAPFRSRGRVGVPLSAALHGSTEILPTQTANFFQIFLRTAKCARLQNANGRKGIKKCIYMIIQFIFMGRNFPGGGRAFFDMSMTVGFCR